MVLFVGVRPLLCQEFRLAEISFNVNGVKSIPFAGGLRAPQFSVADINLDGIDDLVVFDRAGATIIPLIGIGNGAYRYDPGFRSIFPRMRNWMFLRDYNGDGIPDLFCSPTTASLPGVELWIGEVRDNQLFFNLKKFPGRNFDVIHVPVGSTSFTQLYVSPIDLPHIGDVDDDGDIDILAFEPSGQSVYFYRNMSTEFNLPVDTVVFRVGDVCYGKFIEGSFSESITLSPSDTDCAREFRAPDQIPLETRHAGSVLTSLHLDDNGLQDILLGDVSYNGIVALYNHGQLRNAWMTAVEKQFPDKANPIEIELFNAVYVLEERDNTPSMLVIAPNDPVSSQTTDHIWLYEQDTELGNRQLVLKTKNFLVDEMVFFGENTAPLFWDFNGDGLIDILVGHGGFSPDGIARNPALALFQNVGKPDSPKYILLDPDYLRMSRFSQSASQFTPAIGDIDGDGDIDMIIGDNRGRLTFINNRSGKPDQYVWDEPIYGFMNINVGAWARPVIYDVDGDGLGDLIIGEQNFNSVGTNIGSINLFKNIGQTGMPVFEADENNSVNDLFFGKFFMRQVGFVSNYSAPHVIRTDEKDLLAIGSQSGRIFLYEGLSEGRDSFLLLDESYGGINEGFFSVVSFADINNNGFAEMVIGTRRGGLAIFHTPMRISKSTSTTDIATQHIDIFPNPTSDFINLKTPEKCHNCQWQIFNIQGQLITSGRLDGFENSQINVAHVPAGSYEIIIRDSTRSFTSKVIKID